MKENYRIKKDSQIGSQLSAPTTIDKISRRQRRTKLIHGELRLAVIELYCKGDSQVAIAKKLKVSQPTISRILTEENKNVARTRKEHQDLKVSEVYKNIQGRNLVRKGLWEIATDKKVDPNTKVRAFIHLDKSYSEPSGIIDDLKPLRSEEWVEQEIRDGTRMYDGTLMPKMPPSSYQSSPPPSISSPTSPKKKDESREQQS